LNEDNFKQVFDLTFIRRIIPPDATINQSLQLRESIDELYTCYVSVQILNNRNPNPSQTLSLIEQAIEVCTYFEGRLDMRYTLGKLLLIKVSLMTKYIKMAMFKEFDFEGEIDKARELFGDY